jgi:hypothetical protein
MVALLKKDPDFASEDWQSKSIEGYLQKIKQLNSAMIVKESTYLALLKQKI